MRYNSACTTGPARPAGDEEMDFYTAISEHYDQIFPDNPDHVEFITGMIAPGEGKRLLDAGCGTGGLAIALAKRGYAVSAVDLDGGMIAAALRKSRNEPAGAAPEFRVMDMRRIGGLSGPQTLDGVICFGNTLVHLDGPGEIRGFIGSVHGLLKPGGAFLLQVLNYDYILGGNIGELPLIANGAVRFERRYEKRNDGFLDFATRLTVGGESREIVNRTKLYPLRKDELAGMLTDAGFLRTDMYGSFSGDELKSDSLPLITAALRDR